MLVSSGQSRAAWPAVEQLRQIMTRSLVQSEALWPSSWQFLHFSAGCDWSVMIRQHQEPMAYLGGAILDEVTLLAAVLALDITATTTDGARLSTVADVVAVGVAVGASHLGLLNDLLLLGTSLHGVARFLAVGTVGLEVVHRKSGIVQALKVLFEGFGPTFSQDGTARLGGLLEGNLILLVRVALKINVGVNRGRNALLLCDEVPLEVSLAEALFELNKGKLRGDLAVDPEGLVEIVDVSNRISENQVVPSLVGVVGKGKTIRVDVVLLSTSSSGVASAGTLLADGFGAL